jgi:hypothetical protein
MCNQKKNADSFKDCFLSAKATIHPEFNGFNLMKYTDRNSVDKLLLIHLKPIQAPTPEKLPIKKLNYAEFCLRAMRQSL